MPDSKKARSSSSQVDKPHPGHARQNDASRGETLLISQLWTEGDARGLHRRHLLQPEFLLLAQPPPFGDLIPLLYRLIESCLGRSRLLQRLGDRGAQLAAILIAARNLGIGMSILEAVLDSIQIFPGTRKCRAELLRGHMRGTPGVHKGLGVHDDLQALFRR